MRAKRVSQKLAFPSLLGITLLFGLLSALTSQAAPSTHLIIMEAGSDATQLTLYRYSADAATNRLPQLQFVTRTQASPGITDEKLYNNSDKLNDYFGRLLQPLDKVLSNADKDLTTVYLYATGTMRYLAGYQQSNIINQVQNALVATLIGFNYNPPDNIDDQIKLLSAEQQNVFAWLSTNEVTGKLQQPSLSGNNTAGVLSLLPGSSSITFLTEQQPKRFGSTLILNKNTYYLYSHSYSNSGNETALTQLMADYFPENNQLAYCFPPQAQYPLQHPTIKQGLGDWNKCLNYLQTITFAKLRFGSCQHQYQQACSKMGAYQPATTSDVFYGLNQYDTTLGLLGLTQQTVTVEDIQTKAQPFCQQDWATLQSQYKTVSAEELVTTCFSAAWMTIQMQGLLPDTATLATTGQKQKNLDWTLGAGIYILSQPHQAVGSHKLGN